MKGAKRKVLTSGRLTGGVKVQPAKKQVAPNPAPAACPEPAYSLYSTDSEDQVTTLHKGLDRCAALLNGILQAEKAASPSFPRAVTGGVAKSRPTTSLGKKTTKKLSTKTVQRSSPSGQCGPSTTTPRPSHRSTAPAAHSGVKLHPPRRQPHTQLQSHLPPSCSRTLSPTTPLPRCQTSTLPPQPQTSISPLQPQPSILLSVVRSSSHSGQLSLHQTDSLPASEADTVRRCNAECDAEEDEFVPVRDINTHSAVTDTHTNTHTHTCTMKMSNTHLEPGQGDVVPQDSDSRKDCGAQTDMKMKTVQYLLEELKALIAGPGSVAEMLLSHLEQTVSSPQVTGGSSIVQTVTELSSLHSQNTQLRRSVRILKEQLEEKEEADRQQKTEALSNSEVLTLQEELTTAQSRLQELHDDLIQLRKALEETRSQLRDREAENTAIKTELDATRSRLVENEQEKSELAALAQQRLEEIESLNRMLQSQDSSDCPTVVDSVSDTQLTIQQQHREHPAEPPTEHITQYLMSLDQLDPAERACVAAEREANTAEKKKLASVQLRDALSQTAVRQSRCSDEVHSYSQWLEREHRRLLNSTLPHCDVESVRSDCSVSSDSTFNTRDEAAFRDGLAALDASIASLQKTLQLDLRR